MNARLSAVSFYMLKQIELQSFNRKTTITHNNFRHCRVKVLVSKTTFLETAVYTTVTQGTSRTFLIFLSRTGSQDLAKYFEDF